MVSRRWSGLTGLVVSTTVLLSACGDDGGGSGTTAESTPSQTATDNSADEQHNAADLMFAKMMIPHHAQAIEMSDVVLGKEGIDPRVTTLAEQIKAAQGPEIEQLQVWLTAWGEPLPPTDGSMDGMDHGSGGMGHGSGGMMSAEDMTALADASGPDASRLFLQQMIVHHRGAIEMAQAEVTEGSNPAARQLAQKIVEDQEREITEMENLLNQL
ncbi:DUF305 domain-containing protein [Thalassiella azotivora]